MRYQMDSTDAGEPESSAYVALDRDPQSNPAIFVDCSDLPSLTRQEFAAECDINTLMARYETTGVINHFNRGEPQYLDITDIPDLQNSLHILAEATTAFYQLPALVRKEFDNDPTKFVEFASNPDNLDKMREYGLAPPAPIDPPPQKVEIINPAPVDKSGA